MTYEPIDYLPYDFANRRHIGPSPEEMARMFNVLGVSGLDQLVDETVPANIRQEDGSRDEFERVVSGIDAARARNCTTSP